MCLSIPIKWQRILDIRHRNRNKSKPFINLIMLIIEIQCLHYKIDLQNCNLFCNFQWQQVTTVTNIVCLKTLVNERPLIILLAAIFTWPHSEKTTSETCWYLMVTNSEDNFHIQKACSIQLGSMLIFEDSSTPSLLNYFLFHSDFYWRAVILPLTSFNPVQSKRSADYRARQCSCTPYCVFR